MQDYLEDVKPIHKDERDYVEHTQDLIILRRAQDPDIVGHMIERWAYAWLPWIPILLVRPSYSLERRNS